MIDSHSLDRGCSKVSGLASPVRLSCWSFHHPEFFEISQRVDLPFSTLSALRLAPFWVQRTFSFFVLVSIPTAASVSRIATSRAARRARPVPTRHRYGAPRQSTGYWYSCHTRPRRHGSLAGRRPYRSNTPWQLDARYSQWPCT